MNLDIQQPAIETPVNQHVGEGTEARSSNARAAWLAWSLCALSVTFGVLALVLLYANRAHPLMPRSPLAPWFVPAMCMFPIVGAVVASSRPRNPIGWIYLAIGLAVFAFFAEQYSYYTLVTNPGSLPGGRWIAWTSTWTLALGAFLMLTFGFLLFPDGRLPSRRWRPVAWSAGVFIAAYCLVWAIGPGPILTGVPASINPIGIEQLPGAGDFAVRVAIPVFLVVIVACAFSLIERYRHAKPDERQQLKWIAYASCSLILVFSSFATLEWFFGIREHIASYLDLVYPLAPLPALAIATFPVAVGIAILRHHLFDIDLIINRTLVYVPLTAILAGVYSASVVLFQKLFIVLTGESSDAAIVLTTLILAASFTPIKNWLQALVDRRFKEAPNAEKQLKAFAQQIKADYGVLDPEKVTCRLLEEAAQAFEAQSGVVYLERNGHMEKVHTYGHWQDGNAEISAPLEQNGRPIGMIRLGARIRGHGYTEEDREALRQVASVVASAIRPTERA